MLLLLKRWEFERTNMFSIQKLLFIIASTESQTCQPIFLAFRVTSLLYSTRRLKECCSIWHQNFSNRSFTSCKLQGVASMISPAHPTNSTQDNKLWCTVYSDTFLSEPALTSSVCLLDQTTRGSLHSPHVSMICDMISMILSHPWACLQFLHCSFFGPLC